MVETQRVRHASNSLDDSDREIVLMPQELRLFWPSLVEPMQFYHNYNYCPGETNSGSSNWYPEMSNDAFWSKVDQMKDFIKLVIKIAFNHFYNDEHDHKAKNLYESIFSGENAEETFTQSTQSTDRSSKQDLDLMKSIDNYVNLHVLN